MSEVGQFGHCEGCGKLFEKDDKPKHLEGKEGLICDLCSDTVENERDRKDKRARRQTK
jgi:hypothetical protein